MEIVNTIKSSSERKIVASGLFANNSLNNKNMDNAKIQENNAGHRNLKIYVRSINPNEAKVEIRNKVKITNVLSLSKVSFFNAIIKYRSNMNKDIAKNHTPDI